VISPYRYFHDPKLRFPMLIPLLVFRNGKTPLYYSLSDRKLEACRLLLQSGADVNARNK
jgi:ankyrin repeat protein